MRLKAGSALIMFLTALLAGSATGQYSEDYKRGFEDAANIYKPAGEMAGFLRAMKSDLDGFKTLTSDSGILGIFAERVLNEMAPRYNDMAQAFNDLVPSTNGVVDLVLGPGHDDLKFDQAPRLY